MIDYNSHRWSDHLFDVTGSMVREIIGRVSLCLVWTVGVVAFHHLVHPVGISPVAHTIVGVAIGLLLVFRTNASYDRYWEGRRLWGSLINDTRNLGRGVRVLLGDDPALRDELLKWVAAFPFAMKNRLRGRGGIAPAVLDLPADALAVVETADHGPYAVSIAISRKLNAARTRGLLSDYLYGTLDVMVSRLLDDLGGCERIHSTPLPFVYVVHLRRALILYCFTLPFVLLEPFGAWTILASLLIAYLFFGIEEIGVEIEDPFGVDSNDLPLERYCQRIANDLLNYRDEPNADDLSLTVERAGIPD